MLAIFFHCVPWAITTVACVFAFVLFQSRKSQEQSQEPSQLPSQVISLPIEYPDPNPDPPSPPIKPSKKSDIHRREHELKKELQKCQARHNLVEVIRPYLYLGDRYTAYDLADGWNPEGITHVVNVADNFQSPVYPEDGKIKSFVFPMNDEYTPNFLLLAYGIIELIQEARDTKSKILIHCKHGRNRSVAVVAAYLLREGFADSLFDALRFIQRKLHDQNRENIICPRLHYVRSLQSLEFQTDAVSHKRRRQASPSFTKTKKAKVAAIPDPDLPAA
jgi:protein-tyrosine phosphatase